MKKRIVLVLLSGLCLGVLGCGGEKISKENSNEKVETTTTEKSEEDKSQAEQTELIEEQKATPTEDVTEKDDESEAKENTENLSTNNEATSTSIAVHDADKDNVKTSEVVLERDETLDELKLDEPYTIETENGSYSFTIKGMRRTDWMQDEKSEAVVLEYEVENKDYTPNDGSLLLLGEKSFRVEGGNKKEFEGWNSTMSEFGFPDFVEAGEKKEQEQPYVVEKGVEQVRVIFQKEGKDIADIVINIE